MTSDDRANEVTLHIDIRDGWSGEELTVYVNDELVFGGAVTTRPQIGLATQFEVRVPSNMTVVDAKVKTASLVASWEALIDGDLWLGISRRDDTIEIVGQDHLFGYV
jgi:hypothetical protein